MKKRISAMLLTLVMLIGLMPTAMAAEPTWTEVNTVEALKSALTNAGAAGAGNSYIKLTSDIEFATGDTWTAVNVDGQGGADIVTLDGCGYSISGLPAPLFSGGFAGGSGIIIKDLTIKNSVIVSANDQGSGAFIECVDSMDVITLEKCHLLNSTVKGSRTGGLIGWTSGYNNQNDGAVKTYVTIDRCSVIGCTIENTFSDEGNTSHTESVGAIFGHAGANAWTFTTISDCVVSGNTLLGGSGKTGVLLGTANVGEITVSDCTMSENTVNNAASSAVYGRTSLGSTGVVKVNGVVVAGSENVKVAAVTINGKETSYKTLSDALTAANSAADNSEVIVTLLEDVTLNEWTSVDVSKVMTLNGNGKTITGLSAPLVNYAKADFTVKDLTISGANIEVKSTTGADSDTSAAALVQWLSGGANLTLNNVSVKNSTIKGDGYVAALVGFAENHDVDITVTGGAIEGNTLTAGGTVGGIIAHTYVGVTVTDTIFSNNTLESTSDSGSRPDKVGIVVGRTNAHTTSISATVDKTNKITPVGEDGNAYRVIGSIPGGSAILTGGSYPTDPIVTGEDGQAASVVDGYEVVQIDDDTFGIAKIPVVANIEDTEYTSLADALQAAANASGDITVEILDDIDLGDEPWTPIEVSGPGYPCVTVNGNNHTITGLTDMLFSGTWAGNSGLIINDLTIEDSTIVHDKDDIEGDVGVGAFVGYPQASAVVTLNNCHLVNSSVEGGHWTGGLVGAACGYSRQDDGPVFMTLTIKDCSVTGSTITGKGSVGGIIGHSTQDAWTAVNIENAVVKNNTITSTGDSSVKAGSIVGTIGAAGIETSGRTGGTWVAAEVYNNTVTSNGTTITNIYGRQGNDTGRLNITGGSYDSNPVTEENKDYVLLPEGYEIVQNNAGKFVLCETDDLSAVTLTASPDSLRGGGTVTLTVGGVEVGLGAVVCDDSSIVPEYIGNGQWTAVVPNEDAAYTFSVTGLGEADASCVVTVRRYVYAPVDHDYPSTYTITVEDAANGEVRVNRTAASKGTTVTITVTPDDGYELEKLTVIDARGEELMLTSLGNGKYNFTMPARKVTVNATFEEKALPIVFTDVFVNDYYYDAVYWAVENGVTNGTNVAPATFSPLLDCTRAQAVTFLWRAAGSPEPETTVNPFTDVPESEYYYEAVLWAVENGITNGTNAEGTTFSPDATVTRAQVVTFLYRLAGSPVVYGSNNFVDVPADEYYANAVQWAVAESVTNGTGTDPVTFSPELNCNRSQIVTFLYRHFAK